MLCGWGVSNEGAVAWHTGTRTHTQSINNNTTNTNNGHAPSCGRFFSAFSFSCSVDTFFSQRARPLGMSSASLSLEEEESESESDSHSESDPSSSCNCFFGLVWCVWSVR